MDKKTRSIIIREKKEYINRKSFFDRASGIFVFGLNCQLYYLIHYYRKYNFYLSKKNRIFRLYYERKYRKYAMRTNCEIYSNNIGENFRIYHGGVIIGSKTIIKNNVKMHGHNCLGNNGKTKEEPVIGSNVDIGVGATIIGGITIADNITIGANSVVVKSFLEPGITIAGNPARKIK